MSRIGQKPVIVSEGVTAAVSDGIVTIKGPKGELQYRLHPDIAVVLEGGEMRVAPRAASKKSAALWGLTRSLIANMAEGVLRGFRKELEYEGIGFRAELQGSVLVMQLGFSHPVRFTPPSGVTLSIEKNVIAVAGVDKGLVGDTAARIRALKPPEPYKGKGIRYRGEVIRRKAGKKAVASA